MSISTAARAPSHQAGRSFSAVRPDLVAGFLLLIGGTAAAVSLLLPWKPADGTLRGFGSITGWDLFTIGRNITADPSWSKIVAVYSIPTLSVVGVASVLFALMMFARIDHLPPGTFAMLMTAAALAGGGFWLVQGGLSGTGIQAMLAQTQVGWFLGMAGTLVALIGAIVALARS
ncbi:hypothetical protein [Nakamurella aerolata]|uniref:Uncharacterized protein n=1 Tax=Nakamurella aerolata TaxID=1656892 RepID=A0A849ADD9_9ACTN|nr:hypothetical protein [Nakamurella aerolata]NNG37221.1 hypothetical protein [Nakamurella aerolata]